MNVLIIEDERHAADKLKQMLVKTGEPIKVLDTIETVEQAINWLSGNEPPDLIFMDIQLNDGVCFEIFESVKVNTPVIFTTAYDEYAIRAFKVNSIDYLLKPVDLKSLTGALIKFKTYYQSKIPVGEQLNRIFEQLIRDYKSRFFVKIGSRFKSVPVNEIECFYILDKCVFLKLFTGKSYDLDYSLDQIGNLTDPKQFYRINRTTIVNMDAITDLFTFSASRLKLKLITDDPAIDLYVSRDKTSDFKRWLGK